MPFPSPVPESESEVAQSCLTFSDPMDYSLPGSPVHGILQARVLEWVAIAFTVVAVSRGSSLVMVSRLLTEMASVVAEHGL